ncbi:MAG: DUF4381 domain-containing protein [Halieaceae bacterium]|nr:DUF4381 domain-containing protein [Halieaceae bacterium]MCP5203723.1 DUF4381 domain-containing protein [Pseudomonadales bacterium]
MSAPPLPEAFGNYALGDFVEVVSPADVSWWPQTVGWLWLGAALLAWLGYRLWRLLVHWYRNRYRREAIARLRALPATAAPPGLVADINRLLKLTALAAFPRGEVASLSGEEWVAFLNRQCPQQPFSPAQCRLLALGPYTGAGLDAAGASTLVDASVEWVRRHENAADV